MTSPTRPPRDRLADFDVGDRTLRVRYVAVAGCWATPTLALQSGDVADLPADAARRLYSQQKIELVRDATGAPIVGPAKAPPTRRVRIAHPSKVAGFKPTFRTSAREDTGDGDELTLPEDEARSLVAMGRAQYVDDDEPTPPTTTAPRGRGKAA